MSTKGSSEKTSIYIIDRDYRLVHFNDALKRRFKDVRCGDVCYEKLCGEDRPCQGCPLNRDSDLSLIHISECPLKWKGSNLLGFALTEARDLLLEKEEGMD